MQRTSTRFLGCMWQQASVQHLLKLRSLQATNVSSPRHLASRSADKGGDNKKTTNTTTTSSSSSSTTPTTPTTTTATTTTPTTTTSSPTPPTTKTTTTTSTKTTKTTVMTPQREAGPRAIMREDNMWKDPQKLDTKWLRPRDPRRYRPDFKQTEPHSLRKQFMRSPDERTRDAMGRDWEAAIHLNENRRRQALLAYQKRHQEKFDKLNERKDLEKRTRSKLSKKDAKNRKVGPPADKQQQQQPKQQDKDK